jgi:hypothetical protein
VRWKAVESCAHFIHVDLIAISSTPRLFVVRYNSRCSGKARGFGRVYSLKSSHYHTTDAKLTTDTDELQIILVKSLLSCEDSFLVRSHNLFNCKFILHIHDAAQISFNCTLLHMFVATHLAYFLKFASKED